MQAVGGELDARWRAIGGERAAMTGRYGGDQPATGVVAVSTQASAKMRLTCTFS